MIEIRLLLIFMITAAVIAVWVKDMLSSIVAIGAVGIGLSMAFLVLKAPDLAITQLVVEILSLVILVRATIRKDLPFSRSGRWLFNTAATLTFLAIFLTVSYFSFKEMPPIGNPLLRISKAYLEGVRPAGGNVVAALVLNSRALDMLGEVAIIFVAIVGVVSVGRKISKNKGH